MLPEELQEDLTMVADTIQILDRKEQVLKNKVISLVLIQWQHHGSAEATWEREVDIRPRYPHLFN